MPQYLIGIDVGGTNTDSVLIDPKLMEKSIGEGVLAWNKSVTTPDVSDGIEAAIKKLFSSAKDADKKDVQAITIGTTHFINAIIEQDRSRLDKVAILRLCGPYTRNILPFSDFPSGLTSIMDSYVGFVDGGHRIDGEEIRSLNEQQIRDHCKEIKALGIKSIAVVGIFANLKPEHEKRTEVIIKEELSDVNVVLSHEISGINFIERENATILNTSIIRFAQQIINSFVAAVRNLGLSCPVFLTQNNGTILTVEDARRCAIRTFSSGATNSMRGAKYLCSSIKELSGKSVLVGDVGGTTLDVGLLLPSGFPRLSSSFSEVGGVRMNFSMPFVESIGLGGGSIVREEANGELTIGPDSVGADIVTRSLVFGGDTVTTTDVTVSRSVEDLGIGNASTVTGKFDSKFIEKFNNVLVKKMEKVIDKLRTSPEPLPLILVGGGSFIVPHKDVTLEGTSMILMPPFYQVANAIGAAMGKLSDELQNIRFVVDSIDNEKETIIKELIDQCTENIVKKGAVKESVEVIDIKVEPVPYVDRTFSFEVKIVADVDYERLSEAFESNKVDETPIKTQKIFKDSAFTGDSDLLHLKQIEEQEVDHENYKPNINENREWIISLTDLNYLRLGCYVLGCGGGGNPYPAYIELSSMIKKDSTDTAKVIHYKDAINYTDDGIGGIVTVGSAGSPTVNCEQLRGPEYQESFEMLENYVGKKITSVICLEIGGSNGLAGIRAGMKTNFGLPVVDVDLMGRAYPELQQIVPSIYDLPMYPTAMSDGNGNSLIFSTATSTRSLERMIRASLSEVGASVSCTTRPQPVQDMEDMTCHNTLSLAWRIGKAIMSARAHSNIENLPKTILDAIGGDGVAGKLLFRGKIVGVSRKLFKGHTYGEVEIESLDGNKYKIPFKNENICVEKYNETTKEFDIPVCSVPDLISVCDNDTGDAIGTQDYRYGLQVFVLCMAPHKLWATKKGLEIGGPRAFGPAFEHIQYKPIGKYVEPASVIDEFGPLRKAY